MSFAAEPFPPLLDINAMMIMQERESVTADALPAYYDFTHLLLVSPAVTAVTALLILSPDVLGSLGIIINFLRTKFQIVHIELTLRVVQTSLET